MKPTIGRIVHYRLSAGDVQSINIQHPPRDRNAVREGQVLPATVTAVFGEASGSANLAVQLDGVGTYWATSRPEGDGPGQWSWPPRVD